MASPVSSTREQPRFTPDDLLLISDGDRYELDDGRLVELNVGAESNRVIIRVAAKLLDVEERGFGIAIAAETGMQIFPGRPNRLPRPDGGFILRERLQSNSLDPGFLTTAPDLVVEVVSPGDKMDAVIAKVEEYFTAGVRLAWVFLPESRRVLVLKPDVPGMLLGPDDVLDGGGVLPEFGSPVADFFPR
ncbi:hypothetical protein AYO38_07780 [bacterium SCGC AG-212-C10]|nr:hypothetical protein AYO38_07780 [bacterium SCGC AG-212-C10]